LYIYIYMYNYTLIIITLIRLNINSGVGRLGSASDKLRKSYLSNQLKFDVVIFFLTFDFTNIFKYTIYTYKLLLQC
jgi:hypothetical protein